MSSPLANVLATEGEKLLACVHCGLCLEACPTYVVTGDENDSPRGRVYLMRAVVEGRLAHNSPSFERHIDRCLGCRACEPVCPAGVDYGQLLEGARAQLFDASTRRGLSYKLLRLFLRHVWRKPARLKFMFAGGRVIRDMGIVRLLLKSRLPHLFSSRVEFGLALLESSSANRAAANDNEARRRSGTTLAQSGTAVAAAPQMQPVLLFRGCVTEGLFARVNRATERVLEVNGAAVRAPGEQVCCGALHAHAGDLEGARELARKNIAAFEHASGSPIITNAGGCGAMLVTYGHLLANEEAFAARAGEFSKRVRDVSQYLETNGIRPGATIGQGKVTYDASCHLINGQHAGDAPLKILRAIPDGNLVPLEGSDRCCGGAGVYNLMEKDLSGEVLDEKLRCVERSGAAILATGNPGCHMQIGAGAMLSQLPLQVCHPLELLDESYRRAGFYAELH